MSVSGILKNLAQDPRHFQIFSLLCLQALLTYTSDFAPTGAQVLASVGGCVIFQIIFSKIFSVRLDLRSPVISGLSLSFLLKTQYLWIYVIAAFITIASKFLIRVDGRHVFNPNNFAIVVLLLLAPSYVWVSTGQWGNGVLTAFLFACLALLVLYKIPRRDMAPMFLICWAALLFARALWLGDPISIPIHQLQSGALLIFGFFMISDPKTIPNSRSGRFIFALLVAVIAYIMQFHFYIREALFYALTIACIIRPVIDRIFPGSNYEWGDKVERSEDRKIDKEKEIQLCTN